MELTDKETDADRRTTRQYYSPKYIPYVYIGDIIPLVGRAEATDDIGRRTAQ